MVEYHAAVKRMTNWHILNIDDFKIIMLSERSQITKSTSWWFHLYKTLEKANKSMISKSRSKCAWWEGWGKGKGGITNGPEQTFGDDGYCSLTWGSFHRCVYISTLKKLYTLWFSVCQLYLHKVVFEKLYGSVKKKDWNICKRVLKWTIFFSSILCMLIYIGGRVPQGEGNGSPLQYSCLENPMDGGAW